MYSYGAPLPNAGAYVAPVHNCVDSDDDHVPLGAMIPQAQAQPSGHYTNGTPHAAGPRYDLQLELELEQQQQQFQQQYLQQYRQMQMQQQAWVDDAFAGQGIGGFQSTPHNPNLPQTLGMPAYLHTPPHIAPATRAPNRRPWVRTHAQLKPTAAPHVSEIQPPSSSSEDESSSSDESAYSINSDEEVPIAAANTAPAPVSRREQAQPASGDSSAGESDDDVPLSIISSSSAHNNATVRRTKTVAPAALSPRSQVFKSLSMRSRTRAHHDQHADMSEPESDEDAPLDKLKAELASGTRPTPSINGSSRAASLASVRRTNTASTSTHNASVDVEQTKPSSATSIQSASKSDGEQPLAETPLSASVKSSSPQPTPHSSPALSSCHSAASEADDCESSKPPPPRTEKVPEYLPSGNALPGLPVKRRSIKPRAAVQYIALADIIESTQQTKNQQGDESGDSQRAIDDTSASDHDARSVRSFSSVSSGGDKLMETLRTGPVELLTASTEHSGSKAAVDRVIPEDYGDIDQLLEDLDGIMNGSLAARRRFSLTLMRHSLAVSHGLVEPANFSESLESDRLSNAGTDDKADNAYRPIEEFKPLEISTGADQADVGSGLDLGDLLTTLKLTNHDDDDVQPLDKLAAKHAPVTENGSQVPIPAAAASSPLQPPETPSEPPTQPVELTRSQKIQKALEKLDVMNVRKVSIRIYVQDARRYYTFSLTEFTTSEMIINDMKKSNIIDVDKDNWALFELVDYFGIERPLNHYENLMSVVESWEPRSNNYIIAKGFSQQPALTLLGGVHSGEHAVQGMLYYRVKKSKWQKGVFRLQGHNMLFLKDSRGKAKKDSHYLTLANNDVYTPFQPLRGAPTRFVFGLKSEMPMQMFEKPDEDYVKWFAVQTLDGLRQWLQILRFSKNQIKFCRELERRVADSRKTQPTTRPLVDLNVSKQDEDDD
ncbi:hypothetical protein IWW40_005854, partial [Coemansia sp. RSA 1250]